MIIFVNGDYVEDTDAKISPFDRGFQYADGVYDVLRTYNKKYFMLKEHMERLRYSLFEIKITEFNLYDELPGIFDQLIKKNGFEKDEVAVYMQVTRGKAFPRTHQFPKSHITPTVIITASPVKANEKLIQSGTNVILERDIRWARCDIKSISLLPSVLINQKAFEMGANEAIWIKDGFLTEGTHTNFYGVKDGRVYSYPLSNFILPGITRIAVTEICRQLKIDFVNEGIRESGISDYSEFFITGTTTEVMPVIRINEQVIGDGKPGEVTKQVQAEFYKMISKYG